MSADNGYILRRNRKGQYVLQMYFASADEMPDVEIAKPDEVFQTLEQAVEAHQKLDGAVFPWTEYGLTIDLKVPETEEERIERLGSDPEKWGLEMFHEVAKDPSSIYDSEFFVKWFKDYRARSLRKDLHPGAKPSIDSTKKIL